MSTNAEHHFWPILIHGWFLSSKQQKQFWLIKAKMKDYKRTEHFKQLSGKLQSQTCVETTKSLVQTSLASRLPCHTLPPLLALPHSQSTTTPPWPWTVQLYFSLLDNSGDI